MPGPEANGRPIGRVLIGIAILAALTAAVSTGTMTKVEPTSAILAWVAPLQIQSFTFDSVR